MNKIVLIGNGFDLAHNLNTSYNAFINWYWKDCGARLLRCQNRTESDGLCSFKLKDNINLGYWANVWGFHYQRKNPFEPWDLNDVVYLAKEDKDLCDFSFTSSLLKRIWKQVSLGWVDIENEYFSLLTEEKISMEEGLVNPDYKELNKHLDILRDKLIGYLKSESEKDIPIIDKINDIIIDLSKKGKFRLPSKECLIVVFQRILNLVQRCFLILIIPRRQKNIFPRNLML